MPELKAIWSMAWPEPQAGPAGVLDPKTKLSAPPTLPPWRLGAVPQMVPPSTTKLPGR